MLARAEQVKRRGLSEQPKFILLTNVKMPTIANNLTNIGPLALDIFFFEIVDGR